MTDDPRGPRRGDVAHRTVVLAVAAALLPACAGTAAPTVNVGDRPPAAAQSAPDDQGPAVASTDGFRVTVRADRDRYGADDEVTFTVETCNLGPATTTEEGGPAFGFAVLADDGQVVADSSHVVSTMELRLVRWAAEECRSATDGWDQHRWNRPEDASTEPPEVWGLPVRGERVRPGPYRVRIGSPYGSATSEPFTLDG